MSRRDDALERVKAHLRRLSESVPELIKRVEARSEAEGRAGATTPPLIDPELERQRLSGFAAYLDHYGRVDPQTISMIDLREVLEEAVALTRGEIEQKARLSPVYRPAPMIYGNARQLGQVFISLLVNAAQALPDGTPAEHAVGIELDTTPKGWARVVVADTGRGIHPDVLPRIFEAHFSTKRGAGMGIGLAIVREIVEGLGGGIYVESVAGSGTMFIIELPPVS